MLNRSELLRSLRNAARWNDEEIWSLKEEIDDLESLANEYGEIIKRLEGHPCDRVDIEREKEWNPSQQKTLRELGLEELISKQREVSRKIHILGHEVDGQAAERIIEALEEHEEVRS